MSQDNSISSAETAADSQESQFALFAAGCFWCLEPPYDDTPGVIETLSGYAGGHVDNPSYQQVVRGDTGHLEVIRIRFDPAIVSYQQLLDIFWRNVDFLDGGGQFCDRGSSYLSAIFALNEEQRSLAEASRAELAAQFPDIKTAIRGADKFYPAEDYHQNYYQTNPLRYKFYRWNCGRDARLEELAQLRQQKQESSDSAQSDSSIGQSNSE